MQIVTLVAMHLGKQFTHAVISAPQEQTEEGFTKRDYKIAFSTAQGVAVPLMQVPNETLHPLITGARASRSLGSVKRVVAFLRQSGPSPPTTWPCLPSATRASVNSSAHCL